MPLSEIVADHNMISVHLLHYAVFFGKDYDTGVMGGTVFHSCCYQRGFGTDDYQLDVVVDRELENGSAVAAVAPDDDEPIVYTREGTSYTPARAKQHHPHFLPFKTPLEEKLGLFPELRMSKAKPRGERVPFPNLPNKMR